MQVEVELHFLIPTESGRACLVTEDGSLPGARLELVSDEQSAVQAALAVARSRWGLEVALLELTIADGRRGPGGPMPALVVLETPPRSWTPPAGWRPRPVDAEVAALAPGFDRRVAELLSEWRIDAPTPPLRPRWSRPGWLSRICGWVDEQLDVLGRRRMGPIEQIRHWGISAILRTETDGGRVWCKAVFPLFHHEPAVSRLLARLHPEAVAPMLAVDEDEGWMLLDDVGSDLLGDRVDLDGAAIELLVGLQRSSALDLDEFIRLGCPVRPLALLPDRLAEALSHPELVERTGTARRRSGQIVDWLRSAGEEIAGLELPDTLVHGDFHPANVAVTGGAPVILDWSDAAVTNPLIDAATWATWRRDEPGGSDQVWQLFLQAWDDVVPSRVLAPHRAALEALAEAYHTLSYAAIVLGLEPSSRHEMALGLTNHFGRLEALTPE